MTLRDIVETALSNLGRRKVRTVLTAIGVWVGILTIVTMVSLGIGVQNQITDVVKGWGLETVFVQPKLSTDPDTNLGRFARPQVVRPIRPADLGTLRALPGVVSVTPYVDLPEGLNVSLVLDGKSYPLVLRPQVQFVSVVKPELVAGQDLDHSETGRGLLLSQDYLRTAGITAAPATLVGRHATLHAEAPRGDSADFPATIAGVNTATGGAELGTADALAVKKWWWNAPDVLETEGYSPVVVRTTSLGAATRVAAQAGALGFDPQTLQGLLSQVNQIFAILETMLSSIGLLALLVASVGIANTMVMAIYERTREIGTLKALGASNGDVLRLFVVEAAAIGLLGGICGVVGGWLLSRLLDWGVHQYLTSQQLNIPAPFFVLTPALVAGALAFATLVGLLAGLFPARRAARLDPVAALRHE